MPFMQSLHSKLTLSHLLVTIITVVLLELLILGGTVLYLRSDEPASSTGEEAANIAYDLRWYVGDGQLDHIIAKEYLYFDLFVPMFEDEGFIFEEGEWVEFVEDGETYLVPSEMIPVDDEYYIPEDINSIDSESFFPEDMIPLDIDSERIIIFDRNNRVLSSTDEKRFKVGTELTTEKLVGFDDQFLSTFSSWNEDVAFEDTALPIRYTVVEDDHIGQSVIFNMQGDVVGGIYYRAFDATEWFLLNETLESLAFGLLGATIIAVIVSGVMGSLLTRSFGQRFARLNRATVALADGDFEQRVLVTGHDEIDQVGVQFNVMADQLTNQMLELRQLAERNALLAEEARALAALEERQRLARELHDAIKQQLFGLSLTAGSIRYLMTRDPNKAEQRLNQLAEQSRDIYSEMDRIIHQLRPAALEDRGLAAALQELASKWEAQHDLPITLQITGARELPFVMEQALYRVCQEALNNIKRHAEASQVSLTLEYDLDDVRLNIHDNGKGFDSSTFLPTKALGIRGMQERVSEMGGEFTIKSQLQQGTTIIVAIPAQFSPSVVEYA